MYEIVRHSVPGPGRAAWFHVREDTNDLHTAMATYQFDEYGLADYGPGDVALDLGAHIGGATVRLAMQGAEVYAYEPILENFELLRMNVGCNYLNTRVECYRKAVTRRKSTVTLHVGGLDAWHGWIGGEYRNDGEARKAPGVSLNMIMRQNGIDHVDVVKMDVEGSEWDVLSGASMATLRKIDRIVGEVHGVPSGIPTHDHAGLLEATRGLFKDCTPEGAVAGFDFRRK